jgi:hypothetical protein
LTATIQNASPQPTKAVPEGTELIQIARDSMVLVVALNDLFQPFSAGIHTRAVSGVSEFKRLFEDASRRRFDLVLFWSLDRFSRQGVLETLHHLQRLAQYGVGYRSFTEQYLDSCGILKDAVLSILATIAKQERIRISERVHAGLAKARKQAVSAAVRGWF